MTHFVLRTAQVGLRLALALLLVGAIASQATAVVVHNYLFNSGDGTQILDSAGTADGTALDGATVNTADSRLVLDGLTAYGDLPAADIAINTYTALSLEMWLTVAPSNENTFTAASMLGRIGDEGAGEGAGFGYDFVMLQPTRSLSSEGSRGAICAGTEVNGLGPWESEAGITDGDRDLSDGLLHHMVTTLDDSTSTIAYYVDGVQIGTAPMEVDDGAGGTLAVTISDLSNDLAYIGRSLYSGDAYLEGSVFEMRIYDNALSDVEVQANYTDGCEDLCGTGPTLTIDRDTGVAQFTNDLGSLNVVKYEIASAAGALDPAGWASIADNGDADSGATIDLDDIWSIISSENTLLSEEDPVDFGGPDDGAPLTTSVPLGALWTKSPFEDLTATLTVWDGFAESELGIPVVFTGNGGAAFSRSDFNLDGNVDADDYITLMAHHLTDLGGTVAAETFALGDVDGDLDNDFNDFRLFKADFIAANGLAAFAALTGASVPEPTSLGLLLLSAAMLLIHRCK